MITELLLKDEFDFTWVDVANPDEDELLEAGLMFQLPLKPVHDCLDSSLLPKYEEHGFTHFMLLRCLNEKDLDKDEACNVELLTRKVAIFWHEGTLITLHQMDADFMIKIRDNFLQELKWNPVNTENKYHNVVSIDAAPSPASIKLPLQVFSKILRRVIDTYDGPLEVFEDLFEKYEDEIFGRGVRREVIGDTYLLKRKLSVYRRMLRLNLDAIRKAELSQKEPIKFLEYIRVDGEHCLSFADGAIDNLHNLLNLHVSFQNSHTNEIVRVLTIFSAFFMPLTFIAGVYGMNFEFMPETKSSFGYPAVLLFMAVLSLAIFLWFKKKKWIGSDVTDPYAPAPRTEGFKGKSMEMSRSSSEERKEKVA